MKGVIYAVLAMLSYSSSPTMTRVSYNAGIGTGTLMFSRHFFASLMLLPTVMSEILSAKLSKKQWAGVLFIAITSILASFLFNHAYRYLPSVVSTSATMSYIIFVFVFELLLGREKCSGRRILIVGLAMLSLIIIAVPSDNEEIPLFPFLSDILGCLVFAIQVSFSNSKLMKDVSANMVVLSGTAATAIFSLFPAIASGDPLLPSGAGQWASVIVLAVIGSVFARVFYFKSTRLIGATRASLIDASEPFASAFMAFIFLKQGLTLPIAIGAALMMASVALLLKEKTPGE